MKTSQHVVVLTQQERSQLETLARSGTTEQRTTLRCRIVLAASEGASNKAIAQALNITGTRSRSGGSGLPSKG